MVTGLFGLFLLALLWKNQHMKATFLIPDFDRTQGDVRLNLGAEEVDASRLEAGSGPSGDNQPAGGAGPSNAPPPHLSPPRPRGDDQPMPARGARYAAVPPSAPSAPSTPASVARGWTTCSSSTPSPSPTPRPAR